MAHRRQDEAAELSSLIGDIYDAALNPELWVPVLEKVCAYVPGSMGNLFSQNIENVANRYFSWGHDPHFYDLYLQKYAALNPVFPRSMTYPVCTPFTSSDIIPFEEMRKTQYHKGWLEPQGYIDFVGCNLERTATGIVALAVIRHQRDGFVDAASRQRVGLLAPHLRRAMLIGKIIDFNQAQTKTFSEAIDGLAAGVFLVGTRGNLVHANTAGRLMLDQSHPLKEIQGVLFASDETVQRDLRAAFAAAAAGDIAMKTSGIAVPIKGRDDVHFVAHVLPLTAGARREAGRDYGGAAALFVRKATIDLATAIDAAAQLYGLTPAEVRVLKAVIDVGGVAAVASMLGASRSTVKTHLEHLFEKTGTSRQAELVKLIAGFATPARGQTRD